jgi:hypothetical protein
MKRIGIVLMLIGLLMALFAGLTFVPQEEVAVIGGLHVIKKEKHELPWSPIFGFGVIAIGGAVYLVGRQNNKHQSKSE